MNIRERIKILAAQKKMSVAEIERRAEIPRGNINNWDKSAPNAIYALKVSKILDITVEYLLTGKSELSSSDLTDQEQEILNQVRNTTELGRLKMIAAIMQIAEDIHKELENKSHTDTKIG